jgi:hypothetical protein
VNRKWLTVPAGSPDAARDAGSCTLCVKLSAQRRSERPAKRSLIAYDHV